MCLTRYKEHTKSRETKQNKQNCVFLGLSGSPCSFVLCHTWRHITSHDCFWSSCCMLIQSICVCFVLAISISCVMWQCDVYTQQISVVLGDSLHTSYHLLLEELLFSLAAPKETWCCSCLAKVECRWQGKVGCYSDIRGANLRPGYGYHFCQYLFGRF